MLAAMARAVAGLLEPSPIGLCLPEVPFGRGASGESGWRYERMFIAVSTRLPERIASNPRAGLRVLTTALRHAGQGGCLKPFAHDANRRPVPGLDADQALG